MKKSKSRWLDDLGFLSLILLVVVAGLAALVGIVFAFVWAVSAGWSLGQ